MKALFFSSILFLLYSLNVSASIVSQRTLGKVIQVERSAKIDFNYCLSRLKINQNKKTAICKTTLSRWSTMNDSLVHNFPRFASVLGPEGVFEVTMYATRLGYNVEFKRLDDVTENITKDEIEAVWNILKPSLKWQFVKALFNTVK